jgi:hypothetical protein
MKRIVLAALMSGAAIAASNPANAAIFIGVGFNGGAITQVATDGSSGSANYNTIAGGYFFNTSATGFPLLIQPNLLTQSVNIQQLAGATGGVLNLYITETDLSAFNGFLTSSFTSNTISNATAVLRSFYSASNALFGGTQLQSATFNGMGVFAGGNSLNLTGPFSTTVRYDLAFGAGSGNFNGTVNLTAVPEPATWAMMLFGFACFGYVLRRPKKVAARIRFA